ncbi:MAG TPA: M4 family metallopeptidase [Kofleriaceae bacterium]|nr:M4 family metallopeptidase [Kofleriaceae bacterium]
MLSSLGAPTASGLVAAASRTADAFVATRPAILQVSPRDAFVQGNVQQSDGVTYVPYERTYAGLPVVGGDFVTVIDRAGQIAHHSVALQHPIDLASVTPKLTQAAAETIATLRLRSLTGIEGTQLVVYALDATPRLAWETTVNGIGANGISRLTVHVDALTGAVLHEQEHVMYGTGTAAWNGPNPVALSTTQSGSTFSMKDPTVTNLSCQDAANNTTFSGPDDLWGTGNATVKETGCVDALFVAQTEVKMLSQWLGRNAMDGVGGSWPIRVGLADENAFYDGTQVQVGHNSANQWIGSLDVVGHEMGHGIDDHTPGSLSGSGTQEFVADTFGASTEWFANEPSPFDVPDFTVGETINLVGTGPIRNMANPSLIDAAPNCYSSSIPSMEVHAAAGPGNHWFYLVAEGSNPTNGQPTSPTCNSTTVVGLGPQTAIKIMYNAMLLKTTGASYLKYRTWTLQAAINLFPGSCTQFNTVKAAWDAVSVPAQSGDPTCGGGGGGGGGGTNLLLNPGFESGATSWTATTGVISNSAGIAHTGTFAAWLDGYGTTHTDSVFQQAVIPAASTTAQLCYWLKITTAETTTTTQFDKLSVQIRNSAGTVLTTLATFSNLNAGAYHQVCHNVGSFAGQTVRPYFLGTEDSSLQTSFFIDDVTLQ